MFSYLECVSCYMTINKTFVTEKMQKKHTVRLYRGNKIVFERHPVSEFPKYSMCDVITEGIPSKRKWNSGDMH